MEIKTAIDQAITVLKSGGVILYPTDTVWGLGCDATNALAVDKIYKIKQRADSKSLITLVDGEDMLCRYIREIPQIALQLLDVADQPLTHISGSNRPCKKCSCRRQHCSHKNTSSRILQSAYLQIP